MKFFWLSVFLFFLFPSLVFAKTPNDPEISKWYINHIGLYEAWDYFTGSSDVVVAVIDNGFDTFHPDIFPNVWKNVGEIPDNGSDDDQNGYVDDAYGWNFLPQDIDGNGVIDSNEEKGSNSPQPDLSKLKEKNFNDAIHHGTLVAGLIGAVGNNGQASAGVNWQVKLMNLRVIDNSGSGSMAPLDKAIRYAVDNGADIINMSMVGYENPQLLDAIKYAYDHGVAMVAAAGNSMLDLDSSGAFPICADASKPGVQWILGVSAIDENHHLAVFSNTGSCVDITAPGVGIFSTEVYAPAKGLSDIYGGPYSGTSFAAPLVSGSLALLKGIHPDWGPKELYDAILKNVHHTPSDDEITYAKLFGVGLLQVDKSVEYASKIPVSNNYLSSLVVFDGVGNYVEKKVKGKSVFQNKNSIQGYDEIARFKRIGSSGWVTLKNYNKKAEIVLYDEEWKEIKRFAFNTDSILGLSVGDVMLNTRDEIIVYPKGKSKNFFRIFDLNGNEIKKMDDNKYHSGLSLSLYKSKSNKDEIVVLVGNRLVHYNFEFTTRVSLVLKENNLSEITVADVDGDGVAEYVIGSAKNKDPFVYFYDKNGSVKRKFLALDPQYKNGFRLNTLDFDRDGKSDVVISKDNAEIVVVNYRGKKILEWRPFAVVSGSRVVLK